MTRQQLLENVFANVYSKICNYQIEVSPYQGNVSFSELDTLTFKNIDIGQAWGTLFDRAWFRLSLNQTLDFDFERCSLVLMVDVGGEGLVYDAMGNSLMGITNKLSSYGIPPDKPGKWIVPIGRNIAQQIYIDASCNDLFGFVQQGGLIQNAALAKIDKQWHKLYYDIEVLCDWESGLSEQGNHQPSRTDSHKQIENNNLIPLLNQIEEYLAEREPKYRDIKILLDEFYNHGSSDDTLEINATGHAHLDIAWMWTMDEGRRKARRTFATALALMDRYDEYVFGASQYQLFDWIRQDDPILFKRIQNKVIEGRFELQGVFWVESDLNLPSLESLIRQIYYGRKFVREFFNRDINYVWEPDVFGFSSVIPQILIKSGVNVICSQKLSQNKINRFPYHSFKWEGLDGSIVLVHHFPEETYDSRMRPASVQRLKDQYKERDSVPAALMVFGVGDGGGGPGEEHLERYLRIKNVEGLPRVKMGRVDEFIEKWSQFDEQMKTVKGELYFERHQGTYTTEVLNKIGNETVERYLGEYELLTALLWYFADYAIDQEYLDDVWKEVLLLQFHDILPGSSFMPVYHQSREQYRAMIQKLSVKVEKSIESFLNQFQINGPFVFNPTGFPKRDWIKLENTWYFYEAAPYSFQSLTLKSYKIYPESDYKLNNGVIQVVIDSRGSITSITDELNGFEYIDQKRLRPMWTIYHELAHEYPAWDFADGYRTGQKGFPTVEQISRATDGPLQQIIINYRYGSSQWRLTVSILDESNLVRFTCQMDWRETNTSVKLHWPISIESQSATCHMQYGNISRPTHSLDSIAMAMDEIYAHQFIDVSDSNKGIALIAPQKYGFRVKDQSLEVSILRSQKKNGSELGYHDQPDYPANHYGDLCEHQFELGLLPHQDTNILKVQQMAHQMKHRVWIGRQESTGTLSIDPLFMLDSPNVTIESIKLAYDQKGIILRIIEHTGNKQTFSINSSLNIKEAWLCDMQENMICVVDLLNLSIKGYEVLTLKIIKETDSR